MFTSSFATLSSLHFNRCCRYEWSLNFDISVFCRFLHHPSCSASIVGHHRASFSLSTELACFRQLAMTLAKQIQGKYGRKTVPKVNRRENEKIINKTGCRFEVKLLLTWATTSFFTPSFSSSCIPSGSDALLTFPRAILCTFQIRCFLQHLSFRCGLAKNVDIGARPQSVSLNFIAAA